MTKQNQATEAKPDRKNRPKVEPTLATEQGWDTVGWAKLAMALVGTVGDGPVETQATQLNDARFQNAQRQTLTSHSRCSSVQRQAIATQIGRMSGNQVLQRIISQISLSEQALLAEQTTQIPKHAGSTIQAKDASIDADSELVQEMPVRVPRTLQVHHVKQEPYAPHIFVQRQPESANVVPARSPDVGVGEPGEETTATIDPQMERRLAYAMTVLTQTRLTEGEEQRLDDIISGTRIYHLIERRRTIRQEIENTEEWLSDLQSRNAALERGEELSGGMGASEEELASLESQIDNLSTQADNITTEINLELEVLEIPSEDELVRMVETEFPQMWIAQAKEIALGMLSVNHERVLTEQERYPPNVCTIDVGELRAADAEIYQVEQRRLGSESDLVDLEEAQRAAEEQLKAARQLAYDAANEPGGLPGGMPPSSDELDALQRKIDTQAQKVQDKWTELSSLESEKQDLIRSYSTTFPLLALPKYYPGVFANTSEEEVSRLTGSWTEDILENIEDTEENILDEDVKVWDLQDVPELTYQQMGVDPGGPLGQAVRAYIADKESDKGLLAIARAVFEVAVVIAATVLTAPAGGWGGVAAGALFGARAVYEGIKGVRAEQAASQVAMDPEIADISKKEPEIGWLILDIATLGLDVGTLVRALRPAARALVATRNLRAFSEEAIRIAPEAAETLTRSAGRRLGIAMDEAVEVITPQSRYINVSRPDLLARYEQLATEKMPAVVVDALIAQRSTPMRRRLQELYDEFEALRTSVPVDRSLTQAEHARAVEILREARDLARADFNTLRRSVWRRLRRDTELRSVTDEMVAAGDAELGGLSGSVRVRTRWEEGQEGFRALEIEHRTRLSDNPWRYNDPANLIMTDSPQNQQFLEALRTEGGIWTWPTDEIDRFVISHGLLDQPNAGAPGAR